MLRGNNNEQKRHPQEKPMCAMVKQLSIPTSQCPSRMSIHRGIIKWHQNSLAEILLPRPYAMISYKTNPLTIRHCFDANTLKILDVENDALNDCLGELIDHDKGWG